MSLFNDLLSNIKNKIDQQQAYKSIVVESIYSVIHYTISFDEITSFRDGVVYIHTNPTIKHSIILKREEILEALKKTSLHVVDIK